jgi:hypothetical protein
MTIWADLDENNVVINVIVADQEFINSIPNGSEFVEITEGGIGWIYVNGIFINPYAIKE